MEGVMNMENNNVAITPKVDRAIVSVSGGLDSTACLFHAVHIWGVQNVVAMSFAYGQRHSKETERARDICRKLGVTHEIQNVSMLFFGFGNQSSLSEASEITVTQNKEYKDIDVPNEYVPNRNGTFTNLLTLAGMIMFPKETIAVVMGMHQDDTRAAYPDCSLEFATATRESIFRGTAGKARLYTPLINLHKSDVVKFGMQYGMTLEDFDETWSCYKGDEKQCGKCPTCIDRIKALLKAGVYRTVDDITSRYDISDSEAKKFFDTIAY